MNGELNFEKRYRLVREVIETVVLTLLMFLVINLAVQNFDVDGPSDEYFTLGDNRAKSSDSRNWGFLPRKNIIGRVALVFWPLGQDNDGLMPNVSQVFANVH